LFRLFPWSFIYMVQAPFFDPPPVPATALPCPLSVFAFWGLPPPSPPPPPPFSGPLNTSSFEPPSPPPPPHNLSFRFWLLPPPHQSLPPILPSIKPFQKPLATVVFPPPPVNFFFFDVSSKPLPRSANGIFVFEYFIRFLRAPPFSPLFFLARRGLSLLSPSAALSQPRWPFPTTGLQPNSCSPFLVGSLGASSGFFSLSVVIPRYFPFGSSFFYFVHPPFDYVHTTLSSSCFPTFFPR